MSNVSYVHLTRQTALRTELDIISANLANMSTTGFRRENAVFSEYVRKTDDNLGSLSMTAARTRFTDLAQGSLVSTGAPLDLAIQGDGFFMVQGQDGERLTRAGSFTLSPDFQLVTLDGLPVLDAGGAPIQLPGNVAQITVAPDGVISADGQPVGQIALVTIANPSSLRREGASLHIADEPVIAAPEAKVAQGFVEESNVNAVLELTRMIEVQRAYELGQSLSQREDEMITGTVQTLGRPDT